MTAPQRDRRPTVVRLGDLSSVVVAVEHMVGFRPTESLVAVALCGPRERMTFSLRLDLPASRDGDGVADAFAQEVARRMAYAKADAVMLFLHTDEPPLDGCLPHRCLVETVVAAIDAPLREAALVGPDRLWSYVCEDKRCCPPEGRLINRQSPEAIALAAEHALLGNVVLGSREDLLASMRPLTGIAAVSMRQAQDRAGEALLKVGLVEFSDEVEIEISALADRFTDPRASLSDDEAARVVIALHDKLLRDEMLTRLADFDDEGLRRMVSAVARRAQPPDDAPVCTLVGFAAYIDGGGVLASAAFERALRSDPEYVMAQYLEAMLRHQIPPEQVRECGDGSAAEIARLRSRRRGR